MGKRTIVKLALCFCLYTGWWGLLYPELLITSDTCRVVCEEEAGGEEEEPAKQLTAEQLYQALQEAEPGQVRYRSRLLEMLEKLWK